MAILENKKVIVIGDRDGIPGPANRRVCKDGRRGSGIRVHGVLRLNERRRNGLRESEKSKGFR